MCSTHPLSSEYGGARCRARNGDITLEGSVASGLEVPFPLLLWSGYSVRILKERFFLSYLLHYSQRSSKGRNEPLLLRSSKGRSGHFYRTVAKEKVGVITEE